MSTLGKFKRKNSSYQESLSFCRWAMEERTVNFNKIIGGDMPKLNERDDENEVGE